MSTSRCPVCPASHLPPLPLEGYLLHLLAQHRDVELMWSQTQQQAPRPPGSSTGAEEVWSPTALPEPPSPPPPAVGTAQAAPSSPCLHPNPNMVLPRDKGCHSAYVRGSLFTNGRILRCNSEVIVLGRKSCFRCAHTAISQHHS